MFKYFFEGGPLFMGMLSIVLLIVLVMTVMAGVSMFTSASDEDRKLSKLPGYIKSLGLFGFVLGMLGQFIGLFEAFDVISNGMTITPALLAGGLKVSSITSIYGMIIFLVSYLSWFALEFLRSKKSA